MRKAGIVALIVVLLSACGLFEDDDRPPNDERPPNGDTQVAAGGSGSTLRFAVIGDFGSGLPAQYAVARRMCSWRNKRPFDVVITTGDNVYPDGASKHFEDKFFTPMACLLDNGVEFHAVLGNHDVASLQGRAQIHHPKFGMGGQNYVVRMNGVRFVMSNSNRPVDFGWLARATRAQPGDRWTIVVFHHPVFSSAAQHGPSPWLQELPDLFVRRGVDLVLNGHDHLYMVTKPLQGIRYAVTGGGGATLYDCAPAWFADKCSARNHFLYVVATEERITVRAIPTSGPPFDAFSTPGRAEG